MNDAVTSQQISDPKYFAHTFYNQFCVQSFYVLNIFGPKISLHDYGSPSLFLPMLFLRSPWKIIFHIGTLCSHTHLRRFPEPQHFFTAEWQNWDFGITIIFYLVIKTSWKFLCILFGFCSIQILNFNAKKQFCKYVKNCQKMR